MSDEPLGVLAPRSSSISHKASFFKRQILPRVQDTAAAFFPPFVLKVERTGGHTSL